MSESVWGTANITLGSVSSSGASVRGVMVNGSIVPATIRGVMVNGSIVAATVRHVIEFGTPPDTSVMVGVYNGMNYGDDDLFYTPLGSSLKSAASYLHQGNRTAGVWQTSPIDAQRFDRGMAPQFNIQSVSPEFGSTGELVQHLPWSQVADGSFDAFFAQFATNILATAPVGSTFSFDQEPDVHLEAGSHSPVPNPNSPVTWPAGWPQNDDGYNTPESYAGACQRVYTVMKPIAPHIDFRFWFAGHIRNTYMESFYPGDAYIDSIGFDPYVWAHNPSTTTPVQKYGPIVDWLNGRTWGIGKPRGLSETGFSRAHGDAAGAVFWSAIPEAFIELDLRHIFLFNRYFSVNAQFDLEEARDPLAWAAFIEAMHALAAF